VADIRTEDDVNATATCLDDSILLDFRTACADLAEAKLAVRIKDTPAARARVIRRGAAVDAILDLGNATTRART
jgi:hypothetical protein